jgi:hypothetical protein
MSPRGLFGEPWLSVRVGPILEAGFDPDPNAEKTLGFEYKEQHDQQPKSSNIPPVIIFILKGWNGEG